jgi:hypothetical protein
VYPDCFCSITCISVPTNYVNKRRLLTFRLFYNFMIALFLLAGRTLNADLQQKNMFIVAYNSKSRRGVHRLAIVTTVLTLLNSMSISPLNPCSTVRLEKWQEIKKSSPLADDKVESISNHLKHSLFFSRKIPIKSCKSCVKVQYFGEFEVMCLKKLNL